MIWLHGAESRDQIAAGCVPHPSVDRVAAKRTRDATNRNPDVKTTIAAKAHRLVSQSANVGETTIESSANRRGRRMKQGSSPATGMPEILNRDAGNIPAYGYKSPPASKPPLDRTIPWTRTPNTRRPTPTIVLVDMGP